MHQLRRDRLRLPRSQRAALLTGVLVGTGTGALAGWPVGLGVAGALTALLLMQSFILRPAVRGGVARHAVPSPVAPRGVEIYHVRDSLLLDRASTLVETLRGIGWRPRVLILDLTDLDRIDATALRMITHLLARGRGSGMLVLVAGGGPFVTEGLRGPRPLPESVVFDSVDDALQRARVHLLIGRG